MTVRLERAARLNGIPTVLSALVIAIATFGWVTSPQASTITFTDEASFLANTTPTINESFEWFPLAKSCGSGGGSTSTLVTTTHFAVTTTADAGGTSFLCIGNAGETGPRPTAGVLALIAGSFVGDPWHLTFQLDAPANAVAFYLTDAAETGQASISTSAGDSFVVANCCSGATVFFGLINTSASFSSFTLTNTGIYDGWGIDEIRLTSVPEPSTIAIIGMALLSLFGFGLMRSQRSTR